MTPTPATATRPSGQFLVALRRRFDVLLREVGKFGVVGAICYVIDAALFNVIRDQTGQPIFATTVSGLIAMTVAFVGNRFWTWRDRDRSGLTREYLLYFVINLVGVLIGIACLGITHYWLGSTWPIFASSLADNISGKFIGVGLASLFRFWAYRRYVFRVAPA